MLSGSPLGVALPKGATAIATLVPDCAVSETVDRLAIVSKKSKETDEGSLSTVSVSSRKAHTVRYEEIMQKLANYEAMYKNENRELEAIGDKGVEVRE